MTDTSAKLCWVLLALGATACESAESAGQVAKIDIGPQPGAGFSSATRAELAKAGGPPMPVKAETAPAATEAPKPAATEAPKPAATEAPKPAATEAPKPAATEAPKPAATEAPKPAATEAPKPAATETPKPAATEAPKPAATEAPKPAATEAPKPPTPTSAPKPTTSEPPKPPIPTGKTATPPSPAPAPAPAPVPAPAATAQAVPSELAAIKLTINEGWLRDSVAPGTFSFFAPGSGGKNIRFVFKYAYEDPTAPLDREAYKTWLGDKKVMKVTNDRQRGAAWFLEGTVGGEASFRYVVTYGGRLVTCGGSLYKQGAAAGLRDLRDEIILQAKAICESLSF